MYICLYITRLGFLSVERWRSCIFVKRSHEITEWKWNVKLGAFRCNLNHTWSFNLKNPLSLFLYLCVCIDVTWIWFLIRSHTEFEITSELVLLHLLSKSKMCRIYNILILGILQIFGNQIMDLYLGLILVCYTSYR